MASLSGQATLTATAIIITVTTIRVTDYPVPARSDINAHCVCNEKRADPASGAMPAYVR